MAIDLHVAFWCNINGTRYKPGQKVTVENDDQAEMLIQDGLCRPADTADADPPDAGDGTGAFGSAEGGPSGSVLPDRSAPKAAWTDYAIAHGMTEPEARTSSKAALIARYTSGPDAPDAGDDAGGDEGGGDE